MGYDRDDSVPFDFEPNGIPLNSKSKGTLSTRLYPIRFERLWPLDSMGAGRFLETPRILRHYVTKGFKVVYSNEPPLSKLV